MLEAGLTRRRRGRGFEYLDEHGDKITDPEAIERIRDLAIPPAWRDVWICPVPNGHLQAVGVDAAGRRQYLYHDVWRQRRDAEKFERMLDFARALPALREVCAAHLDDGDGLGCQRVLATCVRLLDYGLFRIGGTPRSPDVETFGLTTVRKEHVSIEGDAVVFAYPAKGGIEQVHQVVDPHVREVVVRLRRRRGGGPELLACKVGRAWVDVTAADVNSYIKEHAGPEFSAKDFRTWNATVLAAVAVAVSGWVESATGRKRAVARAVGEVAHYLGNTPAVARNSYIDPRVFDRYRSGWTVGGMLEELAEESGFGQPAIHGRIEEAVLELLTGDRSSDALVRGPVIPAA